MARPKPTPDNTLRVQRIIQAPREKVFDAWARPEKFQQWFQPKTDPPSCRFLVQDIREGGRYRFQANAPDGVRYDVFGTYHEVRPSEKLVFTWNWVSDLDFGETLVSIEFRAYGNATEISLTHDFFPDLAILKRHESGWNGCLDRVTEFLRAGAVG